MNMNAEMQTDIARTMDAMGVAARRAGATLALTDNDRRNAALNAAAVSLRQCSGEILAANAKDMAAGRDRGLSAAMLDRLMLDAARIEGIATGLEAVAALPDPLGRVLAETGRHREALYHLRRYVVLNPRAPDVSFTLMLIKVVESRVAKGRGGGR